MNTAPEIRRALTRSLEETSAHGQACAALRQQLHDQLEIAARSWQAGTFDDCARACGFAQSAAQALHDNALSGDFAPDLAAAIQSAIVHGDDRARQAILAAAKALKKEPRIAKR